MIQSFMDEWHNALGDAAIETRGLKERVAEEGQATAKGGRAYLDKNRPRTT